MGRPCAAPIRQHLHFGIVQFFLERGGQLFANGAANRAMNSVFDFARRRCNGQIRFHHNSVHFKLQLKVWLNVRAVRQQKIDEMEKQTKAD